MATATQLTKLSKRFGQAESAWAFGQWELRKRARQKFALADKMLFVREALEQASNEVVADYHASLFESGERVLDATAGIGGDLISLARRGLAVGCEIDPIRAGYAAHNLSVHRLEADVRVTSGLTFQGPYSGAFADPSRRVAGRRVEGMESYAPDPIALAAKFKALPRAVMKLSPMLSDEVLNEFGVGIQFVEFKGECREALLVFHEPAGVWAIQVETRERLAPLELTKTQAGPDQLLAEASPAAVRAHCLGQFGLAGLGDSNGYLTGDMIEANPWLTIYPVLWEGRPTEVAKQLKVLGASTPEIKQRGAGQDLVQLRKKWRSEGNRPVCVALYAVGKSLHAVITGPPLTSKSLAP